MVPISFDPTHSFSSRVQGKIRGKLPAERITSNLKHLWAFYALDRIKGPEILQIDQGFRRCGANLYHKVEIFDFSDFPPPCTD